MLVTFQSSRCIDTFAHITVVRAAFIIVIIVMRGLFAFSCGEFVPNILRPAYDIV